MTETRGEWIRLRDEKPPRGVDVLVTDGEGITLAVVLFSVENLFFLVDDCDMNINRATHWMKLPQLPSKEEIQHERDAAKARACP